MFKITCKYGFILLVIGLLTLMSSQYAQSATSTFYNEADFLRAVGPVKMESFETIPVDESIPAAEAYHDTRNLSSPIPALDSAEPDFDLDGHFTITGNQLVATGTWGYEFLISKDGSATDQVDGIQYLSFKPFLGNIPDLNDMNEYYRLKFNNFNNNNDMIYAFGLYFYNYDPGIFAGQWIKMEFGDEIITMDLDGNLDPGSYFFGVESHRPFSEVNLYTNIDEPYLINIDEVYYSTTPTPIPAAVWLLGSGLLGLGGYGWRRKRG